LAADLKERFHVEPELVKGSGGVFEVIVDGTPLFSKRALGRFPEEGEVARLITTQDS
jgi:selT/selW/selH-like putative selenoprotein